MKLQLWEGEGPREPLTSPTPPSLKSATSSAVTAYVPDYVAFYPWMTVRKTLNYFASFRQNWNEALDQKLLAQFNLDPTQRASTLSKGQKTQVALIAAVCPEPDLLVLDEPTSGLDPIVRREFIQTVIGAYQEGGENRTIFVLTSRSPLFGTIFSLGIPPFLALSIQTIGGTTEFTVQFLYFALPTVWIAGAILGWRRFLGLEVVDGETHIVKSAKRRPIPFRRSSPTWQLFKKEVVLQRMPILLALLAVALSFLLKQEQSELLTVAYPALIIILIGSVACAAERHMGAAEWQAVQPVAFWKQWRAKVFATWAIALLFGTILPGSAYLWKSDKLGTIPTDDLLIAASTIAAGVFILVSVTLYVSSLCNSGIKAMMLALAVNVFLIYLANQAVSVYADFLERERGHMDWASWDAVPFVIAVAGFIGLLLNFAMQNHRTAERRPERLLRQLIVFGTYEAFAMAAIFSFWNSVTY